jgi:hypothetical protein
MQNISPDWNGSSRPERKIIKRLIALEGTPRAIKYFAKHSKKMGDYWYWFMLGTLWVNYCGESDLKLWRRLFQSKRPCRESSLMKPDELQAFKNFPESFEVFRAHRENEKDWISYTISLEVALKFAIQRGIRHISAYILDKSDVMAYFTRREEFEVLSLNKKRAIFIRNIPLVPNLNVLF